MISFAGKGWPVIPTRKVYPLFGAGYGIDMDRMSPAKSLATYVLLQTASVYDHQGLPSMLRPFQAVRPRAVDPLTPTPRKAGAAIYVCIPPQQLQTCPLLVALPHLILCVSLCVSKRSFSIVITCPRSTIIDDYDTYVGTQASRSHQPHNSL